MNAIIVVALTLAGLAGTAVVLEFRPERQAVTLSAFGLTLAVLFMALQAPDVALSEIGVGTVIVPLILILLAGSLCEGLIVGGRSAFAHASAYFTNPDSYTGARQVHSGLVGDYVAWMMTGVVVLGAFIGLPLVR